MRKRVCIIGRVAIKENLFDGQTVKTRILYNELKAKTNWKIYLVDTFYKKHKIWLFLKTLFYLLICKDVFISLSSNGLNFYYKFFKTFLHFKKLRIYHYVIGGNHHKYLQEHKDFIPINKKFKVNWVETRSLIKEFEKLGLYNAQYMPNFKSLTPVELKTNAIDKSEPLKFVIFSRINKVKGIDKAADAIKSINEKYKKTICLLDCYGIIEDDFKEEFEDILKNNHFVSYKGIVDPLQSTSVLEPYFMLLFPTSWDGEGFAGTILDAYFSGIPVIASDWNCNGEVIVEGKTGFLYPSRRFASLFDCVDYCVQNTTEILNMKANCVSEALKYMPEKYIKTIIDFVEKRN